MQQRSRAGHSCHLLLPFILVFSYKSGSDPCLKGSLNLGKGRESYRLGHDQISPWLLSFLGLEPLFTRSRHGSGGKAGAVDKGSREGGGQLATPLVLGSHKTPMAPAQLSVAKQNPQKKLIVQQFRCRFHPVTN